MRKEMNEEQGKMKKKKGWGLGRTKGGEVKKLLQNFQQGKKT